MKKTRKIPREHESRSSSGMLHVIRLLSLVLTLGLSSLLVNANPAKAEPNNSVFAQDDQRTITGVVKDKSGDPLPGVNIYIKGTTKGVITGMDGRYSIEVPANATLVFSFIGFTTQNVVVGNQLVINVELVDETTGLDEVVVTAMGVKAEKKKMNFAVQSVNADDLTSAKTSNFVDALQGKIAGVNFSSTGGSPNAQSQIFIRGISSVHTGQNNEPLFVLDGSPISGGATKAAEINPNIIESVTVLKGAAASALYGQEGANGVILITTKSGQSGDTKVSFNATVKVDQAANVPEIQSMYLRGGNGVYREKSMGGWGPLAPAGTTVYDNVNDFLQDGFMHKYDLSVSGGTDKMTSLLSASVEQHNGVVINDDLTRWNLLMKSTFNITSKLSVNLSLNVTKSGARGSGQIMGSVYSWPIDDNMSYYKKEDGSIRWLYEYEGQNRYESPMNPYWSRNEDYGKTTSVRNIAQSSISYNPIEGLNLTARLSYDNTKSEFESRITPRWPLLPNEVASGVNKAYLGQYWYSAGVNDNITMTSMATYEKEIFTDYKLQLMAGSELKQIKIRSAGLGGYNFVIPGFESMENIASFENDDVNLTHREQNKVGIFGEVKMEYKGIAHVSVTGRNDYSSTMPVENRSYFYPSVTGGIVFTEFFKFPQHIISFGKLRGNWAQVGKDAPPFNLNKYYRGLPLPDGGYGVDPTKASNPFLMPEMTKSWEIGADVRMFRDKTRLDVAYYKTTVENQIVLVRVPLATGLVLQIRNEGVVSNEGFEFTLNQNLIKKGNISWDMTFNFGKNKGRVDDFPGQITEVYHSSAQIGDIRGTAYLHGSTTALSGNDYLRTSNGEIICDELGRPKINPVSSVVIGNREPDFRLGWANKLIYSNLSLSFMFDSRKGGDVANGTLRHLLGTGQAKMLEDFRNREILIKGVVEQPDGSYKPNTVPVIYDQRFVSDYVSPVGKNFIEDGSFIRLSYVTLSYDVTKYVKSLGVKGLTLSATGNNLLLFTKYSGSDPEVSLTGTAAGSGNFGMDYLNVPPTRSLSFSISANF
jgi:TonB-linked SusC/RagA family outer membrane protein